MGGIANFDRKLGSIGLFLLAIAFPAAGFYERAGLDPTKSITQFHQDVWGPAEGLPQDTVPAIAQLHDGYLWFGTELGLVRFDGLRVTVFDTNNTPALKSNVVDALATGVAGDLWIGTRAGLTRFHNGKFTAIQTSQESTDSILSLLVDTAGNLWIGTEGRGAICLRNGHFTRYDTKNGLPNNEVFAITQTADGSVWIGTRDGLSRFQNDAISTYKAGRDLPNAYIRSLYGSPSGTLWIGTNGAGLIAFENGKFRRYTTSDGLPSNAISAIREDSRGSLWIGTIGGGLCRMYAGRFESYTTKEGLTSNDIWAFYEDQNADLWIGTGAGGLVRLSNGKLFTSYGIRQGLSTATTLPIFEDREGNVWIGTDHGGLNRFRDGKFQAFTTKDGLPDNLVFSIAQDSRGDLWVGTRKGLSKFKNGKFTTYTKQSGLPSDIVDVTYADSQGNLWLGTRTGLGKLKDGVFTTYTTKDGMSSNVVQAIYEDHERNLWIGTAGGGLDRFSNGKFEVFDSKRGLSSAHVFAIYEDQDGALWVGTDGGGLDRFKSGRFTVYKTKDGLPDDAIFRILEDDSRNLWMSSDKGVFRVSIEQLNDFADKKISRISALAYGAADGMNSAECDGGFQPAGWKSRDGRLWFPTIRGVVVVDPKKAGATGSAPPIVIEQAFAEGREVDPAADIRVRPGRGELQFRYSAPNLQSPQKTIFKYKLEGFDRNWVDAGTRRTAYYTNIPPGRYRFRVIASNGDGAWSSPSASADVLLEAHFYQTSWFYAVCIFALMSLALAGHMRHVRQANERERILEERVKERTSELRREIGERERAEMELMKARDSAERASSVKSEFLANMSHEIRTPMNGILGMTDLVLATELNSEQHECLTLVKSSADSLLTVINDILDFSKVEAGKLDLDPIEFNLRERLEETVQLIAFRADQKALELICDIDPDVPEIVKADPIRLRQIVLNLLGNAIKFTDRGEVVLQAKTERFGERSITVHFVVQDTGIGIPAEKQASIFEAFSQAENSTTRKFGGTGLGLAISHRLVALMGGKIWVISEAGRGSEFHFTVDLEVSRNQEFSIAAQAPALEGARVLIVEDNLRMRRMLASMLRRWGAQTADAETGEQAIAALREGNEAGEPFSVILADARLGSADGFNIVEKICNDGHFHAVLVMMITSGEQLVQAARCREIGATAYVTKPIREQELRAAMTRAQGVTSQFKRTAERTPFRTIPAIVERTQNPLRILVAEDNRVNQRLIVGLLKKRGHTVLLADNGFEALALLERERVDVVLMDVQMPEMDGLQVTSAIRAKEKLTGNHLPIFAMTAYALQADQERCLHSGMDGHIAKPIRPDELFAAIENLVPAASAACA